MATYYVFVKFYIICASFPPSTCAPKTKIIYLWKPASLSIFFSWHPKLQLISSISFFSFTWYNSCSTGRLSWWVCTCTSSPFCNDCFLSQPHVKESCAQAWESRIPDCIVHGGYWKSAYFSHVIREHEFSVMGLYKLWVNCPLFSNIKNRRMWSEVAWACNGGDLGSIPEWERSPGEGNGYPLQYSYLENSMERGAWWATVHGVAKSQTQLGN